eukprot:352441-Chlamydomonas_euryale.AAC.3
MSALSVHAPVLSVHAPVLSVHAPVLSVHAPVLYVHAPVLSVHAPVLSVTVSPAQRQPSRPAMRHNLLRCKRTQRHAHAMPTHVRDAPSG